MYCRKASIQRSKMHQAVFNKKSGVVAAPLDRIMRVIHARRHSGRDGCFCRRAVNPGGEYFLPIRQLDEKFLIRIVLEHPFFDAFARGRHHDGMSVVDLMKGVIRIREREQTAKDRQCDPRAFRIIIERRKNLCGIPAWLVPVMPDDDLGDEVKVAAEHPVFAHDFLFDLFGIVRRPDFLFLESDEPYLGFVDLMEQSRIKACAGIEIHEFAQTAREEAYSEGMLVRLRVFDADGFQKRHDLLLLYLRDL